jgi:hypothetical protein
MPNRGSRLEAKLDEYKAVVLESKPFNGDSLELLRAVYRGDYFATHDQIYAASQVLRFEHPPAVTVDGCGVEQIREEVRQEFLGGDRDGGLDRLVDEIKRHRKVIIEARDQQLRAWVDTGQLSAEQAQLVRSMWADVDEDAPFHVNDLAMPDGGWRNGRGTRIPLS